MMTYDTTPNQSTADIAAIFISLIRLSNVGQDVGDDLWRIGSELRARSCHTMEEALAFLSIARTIYGKAAGCGIIATEDPSHAEKVIPLMGDGDFYYRAALAYLQHAFETAAPPIAKSDMRLN